MTTRDPRSRDRGAPAQGGGIDPTQSLSLGPDDAVSHPSLALGTHEADEAARDEHTKLESPNARQKPPSVQVKRPPPVPKGNDVDERVGQILGSYKVLELLGKGGMGYVFRAEHVKLGREVALKLLRSDYAKRRDAVARFFQEARTVNRVRHRNIVDVTDFVELDDGTTFIIMELLRGQSLGRWARTGIDMPRALAVLVQICDGLAAAHSVGVIHRDLKPDNVIVVPTSDGAELVKLLDFGVAKLLNHGDEDIGFQTAAGSVIGTPAYMSPEQAGGMAIDHRSDIYSLGAIMYELFCGTPMFRGRSFGEYVRKHLTEMPVPPSQTEAGKLIDPRLEALIVSCLQKDPNQRFATIANLRDALLGILGAIETHPPSYATASHPGYSGQSNVMPLAGLAPSVAAVMPTMLPQQQSGPQQLPTMAAAVSLPYPVTSTHHPSTFVPSGRTPWWVWAVGGTIAAGLGIGAAVWLAGGTEPAAFAQRAEPMRPQAAPIEEPSPRLQRIKIHFESIPTGAVFAEGKTVELCKTPCDYDIDLKDGGASDIRNFVLRAPNFKERPLVVDLSPSGKREFRETLEPLPTIVDVKDDQPEELVVKTRLVPEDPAPDRRTRPTRTTKATKTTKPVTTKVEPAPVKDPDPPRPPVEPKPKPKDQKIDQAQTLDPFRKKQ